MTRNFIVKDIENRLYYCPAVILDDPTSLKVLSHPIKAKILSLLLKKSMYPAELAKELKMHEQNIYYHIKQMYKSGFLDVSEKKEIRGTTAKKFVPRSMNFAVTLSPDWKPLDDLKRETDTKMLSFLNPFVRDGKLNATIVVGSPDPHGPFKARARDGHYAIELALFLGNYCSVSKDFSTRLDVDVDLKENNNIIIVGGPVTNLVFSKINDYLPARFSEKRPWGIRSKTNTYTDDSVGLISRIPNPFNLNYSILIIAGVRFIGTKAAVMALTRNTSQILNRFTGQKEFSCVVQGFDIDGDGKIDSIDVLE